MLDMWFCIHDHRQKSDMYYEVIIIQYRKWMTAMTFLSFKMSRHLVELMFVLVTMMQDGSPWSQSVFCTSASFLQMIPLNAENTPVVQHSHVAGVEEYHWFFGQFQHSLVPKNTNYTHLEHCLRKEKALSLFTDWEGPTGNIRLEVMAKNPLK